MSMNHDYETGVALSDSFQISFKICESPNSGEITMTSFPVGNKTSLSRKPYIQLKNNYGTLSGSHGCSFRIRPENSPEALYFMFLVVIYIYIQMLSTN